MAFPPHFLDELRARTGLVSVVARRVKLTRKGREYQGLCPFHNEKTPSFTVNEEKGFFHCFGCGAHGDALGFEMRAGHLSFTEAVEKMAAELGLEVPKATPEERARETRRAGLHDAMEAACAFYERQLRAGAGREGLAYLRGRGLSEETIARFRLGWAPESRQALKGAVMSETIPESLMLDAGLLKKPEDGGPSRDYFRARVIFPITDRRGRVIAFGARTLGDAQPKYLNSPDTPLFHKGATLYGLAHAREPVRLAGTVVVAEGYMDVIALSQAGFGHAVAPLGTALTEQQIEELWRLAPEPILCFDGDNAGQRAMARAAERGFPILKPGLSLRFALLPPPEDPDSLIKAKGTAAMKAVLDAAEPLMEVMWRLHVAGRPLDTPERRAALEKELKDKAFEIADETVRWQYLASFRAKLKEAFRPPWRPNRPDGWSGSGSGGSRWGKGGRKLPNQPPMRGADGRLPGLGRQTPPRPASEVQERVLLALVIDNPSLLDVGHIGERLGEMSFADNGLDNLRRGILKHLGSTHDLDSAAFAAHLRSDGFSPVLDRLLDAHERKARSVRCYDAIDEAWALWEDVHNHYTKKDLQADAVVAVAELAQDMSELRLKRLRAVNSQVHLVDNGGEDKS